MNDEKDRAGTHLLIFALFIIMLITSKLDLTRIRNLQARVGQLEIEVNQLKERCK